MSKEKTNKEPEFEIIDVQIPFYEIQENPFTGKLLELETREDESDIILCETMEGKKVYLGGYAITSFFKNFYEAGKICKITYIGKEPLKGGRSVNKYEFQLAK